MGLLDFMNILLNLPPLAAMLVISIAVSAVTTVIYKYTTNQKLLKEIKDDVKRMQAEARSTKEPGRAAQLQKEMMKRSMQQFSSSTKSMLITIVPLFLIFGWMQSNLAYSPVKPGEEFTTTAYFAEAAEGNITLTAEGLQVLSEPAQQIKNGKAAWSLKGEKEGSYEISYSFGNEVYGQNVLLTNELRYEKPILTKSSGGFFGSAAGSLGAIKKDSRIERIVISLKPLRPFGNIAFLGWKPGWLATYIMLSLATSMLLRKWLKVH